MNLNQLRYLIAIADAGLNITQAAARVFATQSGISRQLGQLERELGFRIFLRNGRNLAAITPAGRRVIDRARAILEEISAIRSLADNSRDDISNNSPTRRCD